MISFFLMDHLSILPVLIINKIEFFLKKGEKLI